MRLGKEEGNERTSAAAAAAAGSWHGQVKFDLIKTQQEAEGAGCVGETSHGLRDGVSLLAKSAANHGCSVNGTCKDIAMERSYVG